MIIDLIKYINSSKQLHLKIANHEYTINNCNTPNFVLEVIYNHVQYHYMKVAIATINDIYSVYGDKFTTPYSAVQLAMFVEYYDFFSTLEQAGYSIQILKHSIVENIDHSIAQYKNACKNCLEYEDKVDALTSIILQENCLITGTDTYSSFFTEVV